jgi:transposase
MSNKRRYFSADQKVATIRKHLLEQVPISDICDDLNISSNLFYKWQAEFFENGSKAFKAENNTELKKSAAKNSSLETDITHKNGVIAELVGENIRLKKQNGLI